MNVPKQVTKHLHCPQHKEKFKLRKLTEQGGMGGMVGRSQAVAQPVPQALAAATAAIAEDLLQRSAATSATTASACGDDSGGSGGGSGDGSGGDRGDLGGAIVAVEQPMKPKQLGAIAISTPIPTLPIICSGTDLELRSHMVEQRPGCLQPIHLFGHPVYHRVQRLAHAMRALLPAQVLRYSGQPTCLPAVYEVLQGPEDM